MNLSNRKNRSLIAQVRKIRPPDDYYHGRKRCPGPLPDNVLLFSRRNSLELEHEGATAFHHRWILLVALAGCGTIRIDRKACKLGHGQAVLIPPLHLHDYVAMDSRGIDWLFITFDWPGQSAHSTSWRGVRNLGVGEMRCLREVVGDWFAASSHETTTLAARLHNLLHELCPTLRQAPPDQDISELSGEGLLEKIRVIVRQEAPLSVGSLAGRLGISASHLRARFRKEAGISLGRYLRESRLRAAALALRETGASVKEVADRFGYPDIYTFSKSFKKALGIPPSQLKGVR